MPCASTPCAATAKPSPTVRATWSGCGSRSRRPRCCSRSPAPPWSRCRPRRSPWRPRSTRASRSRSSGRRAAPSGGAWPRPSPMLLVDGAFLAFATYATGGATSSLRFLVYLQLIAVSLLVSYRAGLLVAAWDTLLLVGLLQAQVVGPRARRRRRGRAERGPGGGGRRVGAVGLRARGLAVPRPHRARAPPAARRPRGPGPDGHPARGRG